MKCIGISGTPGTGKTSVAKELSASLQIDFLDLSRYVIENKMYIYYDNTRGSYVVDEWRVRDSVRSIYEEKGALVISSHYIEILPKEIFELVVVLRRDPYELIHVLEQRGWPKHKIAENIEAELLAVCTLNAIEELGEEMVVEIDVSSKPLHIIVDEIIDIIYGLKPVYQGFRIDWLSVLPEEKLNTILEYVGRYRDIDKTGV